jgi:myosin heavy subunit
MELARIPQPQEITNEAIEKITGGVASTARIMATFAPHFAAYHAAAKLALNVDPNDADAARFCRLKLKTIRTTANKDREDLKKNALRESQAIDGAFRMLAQATEPLEEALEAIEKAEERRIAAETAARVAERTNQLRELAVPQRTIDLYAAILAAQDEGPWLQILDQARVAKETADRAAAEAKRKAEAEAEAKRIEDAKAEAQRKQQEAENRAALAKAQEEAREARAKAEAAEAETKRARQAEAQARSDADRAKLEASRAQEPRTAVEAPTPAPQPQTPALPPAAAQHPASDKVALETLAATIRAIEVPKLSSTGGAVLASQIRSYLSTIADRITAAAAKL